MTPADYRSLAAEYTAAGRDADADVCEVLAQEAERLSRYTDEEGHAAPPIVTTPAGEQYVLPGMEATT